MKVIFILASILVAIGTTVAGQTIDLSEKQTKKVQKLINVFKTNNKRKIADLINYPLRREYPLKDVKDKNDFIQRFDEIFAEAFISHIAKSKLENWSDVGWRGVMLDNGKIWMDGGGKITAVNFQSPKEKRLLMNAIQADKKELPKSLQNFESPTYLIFTKNYKIRIDETAGSSYRYASWKIENKKREPDLVVENGVLEFQGSGGNHIITFKNGDYTYIVLINLVGTAGDPDAVLEVLKQEKTILKENGEIKRN
ncbi:hypothetical protein [Niabella aquatica]